ncbi:MAG: glycoside hydrolase family 5 protein [Defluviitaleaceae bacterium]|nr:glycoside hydrolase family 5 protein [Defluviitaleaceae bacterium]
MKNKPHETPCAEGISKNLSAQNYVRNLHAGWNLGNTLDAICREKENPTPAEQETAWHNPMTTRAMIQLVKDAGFDMLRVPVTWYQQIGEDHVIKKEWMDRVQEVVDYGMDSGLTVILNLHHENWHFPSDENYPAASTRMKAVWQQIAQRFRDYDNRLIFEAMNEPRKTQTPVEWTGGDEEGRRVVMQLNKDFVDTVRATGGNNATRMLMVPTYAACSEDNGMFDFVPPADENIIVSLHCYPPVDFALLDNMDENQWTPACDRELDALFARVDKYFLSKGIPVIMGECGARDKNNPADRVAWAKSYMRRARKYGVPSIWWDNGGKEFEWMLRKELAWKYPDMVAAFLEK